MAIIQFFGPPGMKSDSFDRESMKFYFRVRSMYKTIIDKNLMIYYLFAFFRMGQSF